MAFKQALELEGGVPARFIALAKAEEKLGKRKEAIDALESAYELEASTTTLRQILALYEASGDEEGIEDTTLRINNQLAALERKKKTAKKTPRHSLRRVPRQVKPMKPGSKAPRAALKSPTHRLTRPKTN